MSVEMARTAVGRTTIECCVRWCATRCAGSVTAGMTSAESWTSARPTYSWCAVQQAASAASGAASWRLTVEAFVERHAPRCSGLAGASEWCWMERRAAQSCSSRFSRESGCIQASMLIPACQHKSLEHISSFTSNIFSGETLGGSNYRKVDKLFSRTPYSGR